MARETIYASSSIQKSSVGDQNYTASLSYAYDGNTSTGAGLVTGDSTGAITVLTVRLKASAAKTKTWATSRAYGKFDGRVLYPSSFNDGTTYTGYVTASWLYSGPGTFGTIPSFALDCNHDGSTVSSWDAYSTVRSGNPTINLNSEFIELYARAYSTVGGATDTISGSYYEFFVEGFSAPTITSINGGSAFASGSNVTIIGTEFDSIDGGGSNGVALSAGYSFSSFTYNSDTSITVNNVTGPAGSCTFTLTTYGGSVASSQTLQSSSSGKFFAFF